MLYKLKKTVKNTITCIPLTGIMGFVIGAYTIFLIQYFYYDNHINTDGVNSCIAGMALLFTVYAAFKIKEWSETKINEKGFKKCEEIIDKIAEIKFKIVSIHPNIFITKKENNKKFISNTDYLSEKEREWNEIYNEIGIILREIEIVLSLQNQLNVWGFEYQKNYYAFELTQIIIDMSNAADLFYDNLATGVKANHDIFIQHFRLFEAFYFNALDFCTKFSTTNFYTIFTEIKTKK